MERKDDGLHCETWKELTLNNNIPNVWNDDRAGGKGHWVPEPLEALNSIRKDKSGKRAK